MKTKRESIAARQIFIPILRSDALRNDEKPVRIIPVLDAFESRIVRAKKGLLPIDLEQGRLLSEVNKYT